MLIVNMGESFENSLKDEQDAGTDQRRNNVINVDLREIFTAWENFDPSVLEKCRCIPQSKWQSFIDTVPKGTKKL